MEEGYGQEVQRHALYPGPPEPTVSFAHASVVGVGSPAETAKYKSPGMQQLEKTIQDLEDYMARFSAVTEATAGPAGAFIHLLKIKAERKAEKHQESPHIDPAIRSAEADVVSLIQSAARDPERAAEIDRVVFQPLETLLGLVLRDFLRSVHEGLEKAQPDMACLADALKKTEIFLLKLSVIFKDGRHNLRLSPLEETLKALGYKKTQLDYAAEQLRGNVGGCKDAIFIGCTRLSELIGTTLNQNLEETRGTDAIKILMKDSEDAELTMRKVIQLVGVLLERDELRFIIGIGMLHEKLPQYLSSLQASLGVTEHIFGVKFQKEIADAINKQIRFVTERREQGVEKPDDSVEVLHHQRELYRTVKAAFATCPFRDEITGDTLREQLESYFRLIPNRFSMEERLELEMMPELHKILQELQGKKYVDGEPIGAEHFPAIKVSSLQQKP